MAQTLASIVVSVGIKALVQNVIDGGNADAASAALGKLLVPTTALTTGTTADKADSIWQDTSRTLASGATENINVYSFTGIDIGGGAGKSPLGVANTFVEIVGLLIRNLSTSAGTLKVGGEGSANAFSVIFDVDN